MRVVHYLNQFFGGVGGEEAAYALPEVREGAVGPGRLLEQLLGSDSKVEATIICGDNYAAENLEQLIDTTLEMVKEYGPDLFIAGPCYEAGRYGLAAGALCAAVQTELDIPAVTGMAIENPGVDLYRHQVLIVDSGENISQMREVLTKMARLGKKLTSEERIGKPTDEGYIPRGLLLEEIVEQTSAERLVNMLMAKVKGEPFQTELPLPSFESVPRPPAVKNLPNATVALVTDGGLVPKGNPDKIPFRASPIYGSYSINGIRDLAGKDYEIAHRGYDAQYVEEDPNRLVPVDVLRELEDTGAIGKLHDRFFSTSGLANPLSNTRPIGRQIAEELKDAGIDAVILTST